MKIAIDDLSGPEIAEFLEEHIRDMRAVSPPESKHALDLDGLRIPEITFWTLWHEGRIAGCCALRQLGEGHGEIKSMRTSNAVRGRGFGARLLEHLIREAGTRGYTRLSLETGAMDFFEPARSLYRKFGFEPCGPFAGYKEDPNSVFLTKPLSPPMADPDLAIRPATPADARGIAGVIHAMSELRAIAGQTIEATAEAVGVNLDRIATFGQSTAYVAEDREGGIIGYAAVHWVPFLFLPGGEAYVSELFVRPAASGKGIGSTLIGTIVREAKRRGCARVSLLNGRDGEAYRRNFYKDRGWVERDRMANFIILIPPEEALPEPAYATRPGTRLDLDGTR